MAGKGADRVARAAPPIHFQVDFNGVKLTGNVASDRWVCQSMTRHGTEELAVERRREIVQAALALLDEHGFDRLSLRRLATHLGMHAPGLYWYIESKQQLIDLMAKAILADGLSHVGPLADDQSWEDWLVELACTVRHALLAHRDGSRVVAGAYILRSGAIIPVLEQSLEILEQVGFEPLMALGGTMTVLRFATGMALTEQASPLQVTPTMTMAEALAKAQPPDLDESQFPRTAAALHSATERVPRAELRLDSERVIRFGAQMIVRGLAQKLSP